MWAGGRIAFESPLRGGDVATRESTIADVTSKQGRSGRSRSSSCGTRSAYPGLVVHGPLIATLLVDLLLRAMPGVHVAHFAFRAVSPLFDTAPLFVRGMPGPDGTSVHLWAANVHGALAMDATARLA